MGIFHTKYLLNTQLPVSSQAYIQSLCGEILRWADVDFGLRFYLYFRYNLRLLEN